MDSTCRILFLPWSFWWIFINFLWVPGNMCVCMWETDTVSHGWRCFISEVPQDRAALSMCLSFSQWDKFGNWFNSLWCTAQPQEALLFWLNLKQFGYIFHIILFYPLPWKEISRFISELLCFRRTFLTFYYWCSGNESCQKIIFIFSPCNDQTRKSHFRSE